MTDSSLHFENFSRARGVQIGHQTINLVTGNQYLSKNGIQNLILQLNPISDASHTRDRRRSPPDSACFPGTRQDAIQGITSWVDTTIDPITTTSTAVHVYWFHGFAGSGKSAISLEIAKIYAGTGRLLASYFFFRNAGDRGKMNRFAVTLAAQVAAALPPTASFIESALDAEPGLLTQGVSLTVQLERLVYGPIKAALERGLVRPVEGPFLIVIDGLDECEDKQGVMDFIDHMLEFFKRHPCFPLRFFIASRVEEHIRSRLDNDAVLFGNLSSHLAYKDIEMYLQASFEAVAANDRVIRSYVRAHGKWPTKPDMDALIHHVGGSFVFASMIFRFIIQPAAEDDLSTPMDRLPLAITMNGLDGLYAQTLARSQRLPHFNSIISTIALLGEPLPIVGIAALLGIEAFEVVRVLLNLQAIVHLPGTDEEGDVTLCHTSLRDFLTTESRSGCFFVPRSFHLYLSHNCFMKIYEQTVGPAYSYGVQNFHIHWHKFTDTTACDVVKEIERFKAQAFQSSQSLDVAGPFQCAFLCSMSFSSLLMHDSSMSVGLLHLLTECAEQLALALECPGRLQVALWLVKRVPIFWFFVPLKSAHFTEHTFEVLQRNLQRASSAIRAYFPGIEEHGPRSLPGGETVYTIKEYRFSGLDIFNILEWIVTRARFLWDELNETPRPPVNFSIVYRGPYTEFKLVIHRPNTRLVDNTDRSKENANPRLLVQTNCT